MPCVLLTEVKTGEPRQGALILSLVQSDLIQSSASNAPTC